MIAWARRDERVGIVGSDFVARNLLHDELVEGFVVIDRANDVVAISPRLGAISIYMVAVRFSVANQIQPVAAPPFAVVGAGQ